MSWPGDRCAAVTIFYRLPEPAHARLNVYDVLGRRVAVLVDRIVVAGEHRVDWDGRTATGLRAPSGLHVIRLTTTLPGDAPIGEVIDDLILPEGVSDQA